MGGARPARRCRTPVSRRSPPNQRLKLAAPCVGGRVAFVHPTVWRRSLPFLGLSQRMRKTLTAAVELEILDLVEEGRRIAERLEGLSLAIRNDGGARQELIKAHRSVTMHQVVNAQARAHQPDRTRSTGSGPEGSTHARSRRPCDATCARLPWPPKTRPKRTAPVICDRIAFVNHTVWRRNLGASR